MKRRRASLRAGFLSSFALSLLLTAAPPPPEAAASQELVGVWTMRSAEGGTLEFRIHPDGTFLFNGRPGKYLVQGNVLMVQVEGEGPELYQFALQGDRLLMRDASSGQQFLFSRAGGPGPRTAEPPPVPGPPPPPRELAGPPPSPRAEAPPRGGDLFTSSDRSVSFRLPPGWSAQEVDTPQFAGIVVSPGLKPGDIQDARIFVFHARLSREERGLELAQLVQAGLEKLLRGAPFLRPDGDPSIQPAPGGEGGRAVVTLSGMQADGRAIRGWMAALVAPPYSFAIFATVMDERWERYRGPLEALFASLRGQAPPRNEGLERALVGQWQGIYAKTGTTGGSTREGLLILAPDMTFRYRYTSSISAQYASSVSESQDAGRWEVRGKTLFLLGQKEELSYDLKGEVRGGVVTNFEAAGMTFGRSGR